MWVCLSHLGGSYSTLCVDNAAWRSVTTDFSTLACSTLSFPLTEQDATLLVVDYNHSILQLRGQVEREPRPR